jgi:hypothetical protein
MVQSAIIFILVGVLYQIPSDYFEIGRSEDNLSKTVDDSTDYDFIPRRQPSLKDRFYDFIANLKLLFQFKVYIVSTGAVIVLIYVVTSLEYWISDYLIVAMNVDPNVVSMTFIITCVTAPTLGVISGGIIVQRYGGYENKTASLWCVIFASGCCLCSTLIPFFDTLVGFGIMLWIFFFFGGAIVPNINGILISALPSRLRGAGNSLATLFINTFGMLPAPYVYSAIYDATRESNKKFAMSLTINYAWIALGLLSLSMWYRFKVDGDRLDDSLNKNSVKELI